ncbi:MAG TPA: Nif3-like dinuclear metal center hexameric protein [Thermoleophilaceae bacterium]|nr:Nif3-like dinuclear metal center hexameric protein [Thermoleophilaceae bacterium]
MASRDEIVAFLDELLDARGWPDHGPNGLQVPGAPEVDLVISAVSAHAELFAAAADAGAQMVLCHHGILWEKGPAVVTEAHKARLRALFDADLSLVAYHLPLDAHPEVGNNALICRALGLDRCEAFGEHRGRSIGWVGRAGREGVPAAALVERTTAVFEREPLVFAEGPASVRSVGIVSGGGAGSLAEAVERELDALVTGEPSEPAMADAREAGIHFVAAGHYATETLGVRRLGELIAERFGVEHRFVEFPNPV